MLYKAVTSHLLTITININVAGPSGGNEREPTAPPGELHPRILKAQNFITDIIIS